MLGSWRFTGSSPILYPLHSDQHECGTNGVFREIVSHPLPKCPRETSFQVHWLAIDGNIPMIPDNLEPEDVKKRAAVSQQPEPGMDFA